ncbi:pentatricopeptide repeat-containing protein At4g13650-like [Aristolochia californica]|uniref:pentatricopeptide repeat-containing protein At4g13650-like n=1 Tax=Aristolochia californica TaxID=171875 RepID=UPI0035E1C313
MLHRRPLFSRQFPRDCRSLHFRSCESSGRTAFSVLLQKHCKSKSNEKCEQIHSRLITHGTISDTFFANTLISFYSRCGDLRGAQKVFDKILHKNVVSWTSIVTAYVHNGSFEPAIKLFKRMICSGARPNQFTFSVAIHASTSLEVLEVGLQIHGLVIRFGLERDEFTGSSLVDMYFKMGLMHSACCIFYYLIYKDIVSWNIMISGFSQAGDLDEVLRLFYAMRLEGMAPNGFTCASMLKCCYTVQEVEQIHGLTLKSAFECDVVLGSALIDAYLRCHNMGSGQKVFNSMPEKDGFVWCAAISGYVRNGEGKEALNLFKKMRRQQITADQYALSGALKACSVNQDLETASQLHALVLKFGYLTDCLVASVLLDLYSDFSRMGDAEKIFRKIHDRDIVAWNSMIMGYAQMEEYAPACISLFRELILTAGVKPDGCTFIAVLKSCRSKLDLGTGRMIHGQAVKSVHGSETSVGNAIINLYSKCGAIYESDRAFETMYRRDEVSWSTIIGAFEQNGLELEALRRCREMAVAGFGPTQFSFASCISACSGLAALDVGRQFHSLMIKAGFGGEVYVGSSVVDMYAKCGNIEDSICAFHDLNNPNIVAYNTMISGLAQHGRAEKAILIFKELEKTETAPNKTTFICLLTACSHVGLLEESMFFFDMMCDNYKIEPESEHYCCLVDVLGRAGKLDDAYKIISGCLYNVGVSVWRTLLSACWKYKNVSIGEESAKRVMQLDPDDHASYVLLSNLYSEAGLWKESLEVRKKMAKIGVRKDPGSSWVIIKDQVHKFSIGEFSHPEIEMILGELHMLNQHTTAVGVWHATVDSSL